MNVHQTPEASYLFLELFAPRIHTGDNDEEQDGLLNMTNPSEMVFPEINGARPFASGRPIGSTSSGSPRGASRTGTSPR